jgi:hypothetical protein
MHVHNSSSLDSVLSLFNPVHTFTDYFSNIHLSIMNLEYVEGEKDE